jgi:hypothetical protein
MRFLGLSATEFTMLFCSAAFLAVLFYLLAFRRRIARLATDPIWRKVIGRRRTPFRKLLALALQLLILLFLSLVLADPRMEANPPPPPVAQVVVLDTSASMEAQEQDATRLQKAKNLTLEIIQHLGPRDRLMLMAMDATVRPLTQFTADPQLLRDALAGLQGSVLSEDASGALLFAKAALNGAGLSEDTLRRIVIISDRFHALESPSEDPPVLQVCVGKTTENLAVTAFDLRRRSGAAQGSEVFAEVTNYGQKDHAVLLSIHTPSALLGEELLPVPAGQSASRSYFLKSVEENRILATITAADRVSNADGFVIDDRAYALIPKKEADRVLLVSDGNLYLEKALKLNPNLQLIQARRSDFQPSMQDGIRAAIFDGICPASSAPAIYFAPGGEAGCPFAVAPDEISFPKLLPMRGDHPVTETLSLQDVQIRQARHLVPQPNDTELLLDEGGPIMLAREEKGLRSLAIGFDVAKSDLPLRVAFPMLLHNALVWFLGETLDLGSASVSVGQSIDLGTWSGGNDRIVDPKGVQQMPTRLGAAWSFRPNLPGFYSIQRGGALTLLPVNYYLKSESDITGDRQPSALRFFWTQGDLPQELIAGFDPMDHPEPPLQWPTVLLAAAWLLLFDWIFFCFRILF